MNNNAVKYWKIPGKENYPKTNTRSRFSETGIKERR
jgi:hypothetical protein